MKTTSHLKSVLENGEFAVTSECGPPKGADPEAILKKAELLKGNVDAVNFKAVKTMRDKGTIIGGDPLTTPPDFFIGAVANPFADPLDFRVIRLAKKINAGADFIQTQCIYNLEKFEKWMKMAGDKGLLDKIFIIGGVTPLKSAGMARYMKNKVAGMDVPDEVIKRMDSTPEGKQKAEGLNICRETIQRLKEVPGVSGVHVMAIEWEEVVKEIVSGAGLLPRPV